MIFSSFRFLIFFPIVLLLFYAYKRLRYRQAILLTASYVFYASWDPRFLLLIIFSTMVDYCVGLRLPHATSQARKKGWLFISLFANLSLLGFFKYADFFITSFQDLLNLCGLEVEPYILGITLPVGISFYTFQTMSYSLDIYRGKLKPTTNFMEFALFVAFFPQLVAGPIVRAVELLPQLQRRIYTRREDLAEGFNRFALGFTKKTLLADNISPFVDLVFSNTEAYDCYTLWVAAMAFGLQVYCDFSGYSDMAIGAARMMGFRLPENFRFPFTALNAADFWRRWHITLYSFMRDYLYISLGGSRVSPRRLIFNTLFVMTLVGFWHGANWQFLLWGFYYGVLIICYRSIYNFLFQFDGCKRFLKSLTGRIVQVAISNVLFFVGMPIFRCRDIWDVFNTLYRMFTFDTSGKLEIWFWVIFFYVAVLLSNIACEMKIPSRMAARTPFFLRCLAYVLLFALLALFGPHDTQAFVYFQF